MPLAQLQARPEPAERRRRDRRPDAPSPSRAGDAAAGVLASQRMAGNAAVARALAARTIQRQELDDEPATALVPPEEDSAEELQQGPSSRVLVPRRVVTGHAREWVSPEFPNLRPGRVIVETKLDYPGGPGADCHPDNDEYYIVLTATTPPYRQEFRLAIGASASNIFEIAARGNYQARIGVTGGCVDVPFRLEVFVHWRR